MLWTIFAILLVLWLVGMATSMTFGGLLHLLLVIAVVVLLVRLIQGRPPTYGRGNQGEMWKLEDHLWELLQECRQVLSDRPLFFLINAYTARLSPTVVVNLLKGIFGKAGGRIYGGEIGLPIEADGRVLPCGIYGRWEVD